MVYSTIVNTGRRVRTMDKKYYDFTSNNYDRKKEARKALEKNFYVCAVTVAFVGGALIYMSQTALGIVCFALAAIFAILGFVIVRKEGIIDISEDGRISLAVGKHKSDK